jgi:uncharacterized protein YggE
MNRFASRLRLVGIGVFLVSSVAQAQFAPGDGVGGSGTATIKKDAQILRLQISLLGKGKDAKAAVEKIKARRAAAEAALQKLAASPGAVEFGSMTVVPDKTDQQRRMEVMVRQRMQGGAGRPTTRGAEKIGPVTITMSLKVDWPMAGDSPEARLLAALELQDKIKAADLSGSKEAEQLTPEEQESAEESQGSDMPQYYDGSEGPKPGEPVFLYVSKITPQERAKVLAEALAKARTQAEEAAKAAGITLGSLKSVGSSRSPGNEADEMSAYSGFLRQFAYRMMQRSPGEGENDEAIGLMPGEVSMKISAMVVYSIK